MVRAADNSSRQCSQVGRRSFAPTPATKTNRLKFFDVVIGSLETGELSPECRPNAAVQRAVVRAICNAPGRADLSAGQVGLQGWGLSASCQGFGGLARVFDEELNNRAQGPMLERDERNIA